MPNARLSERAPFFAEVDVVAATLPAPRRLWGSDVSESGIFLQTTQPFHVGDRVSLRFDLETREVHVRAAEVMWVRPFEPISIDGKLPGVGLKFVALDPPARAALRRFVAPQLSDTQPEAIADEMVAVSLPPFSQPPLNISLPQEEADLPDEKRVFRQSKPMPVTIGPRSSPPTFLQGWTFRLDEAMRAPPAEVSSPSLGLRFDDARPNQFSLPPDERPIFDVTSDPPEAVMRDGDDEIRDPLDRELEEGRVALRHLPIAEERRTTTSPKKSRALPAAVALLCAGTLVGSGLGIVGKRWERHQHRLAVAAAKHHPTPSTVGSASPSSSTTPSTRESAVGAATPTLATLDVTAANSKPALPAANQTTAPRVAQASLPAETTEPTTASAGFGGKPRDVADVERELPRITERPATHGVKSTTVHVGDAEVVRAFALAGPPRVVVDLKGGRLPKAAIEPSDGISRVRFGHMAKGKNRVVLELDGDKRAKDVNATVDDGILTVTFR